MQKIFNSMIGSTILTVLFLTACGSAPKNNDSTLRVLTSTTFLADVTKNIVGGRAQVDSLLPYGADPHAYQAAPADVAKIAESDLLILNGLGYEHFMDALLENAGGERLIIEATAGISPGKDANIDPHMWLDPNLVVGYVENIRDGLMQLDPAGAEIYTANADQYIAKLKDLDGWIKEQVNTIPAARRLLVTNHEAVGYFAKRYGFEVVGAVIPSMSTEAGTSAKEMAALIEQIKAVNAPAIFLGEMENPKLANQIAEETNVKVVDTLHLESLTVGSPAATYIDMMKHNVTRIVNSLK